MTRLNIKLTGDRSRQARWSHRAGGFTLVASLRGAEALSEAKRRRRSNLWRLPRGVYPEPGARARNDNPESLNSLERQCHCQLSHRAGGFTLVELVIVLMILSVLSGIVILNVGQAFTRGSEQALSVDLRTLQSAVALFNYDVHDGPPWGATPNSAGHYYPTSTGAASDKSIGDILDDANSVGKGYTFPEEAIWVGLLYNSPSATGTHTIGGAAPLPGETGPYINDIPQSASSHNYPTATGTYTWVIAQAGIVYGVYWDGSAWREGFGGSYP